MKTDDQEPKHKSGLRRRAEERAAVKQPDVSGPMPEDQVRALIHELQVHQIELEMQNEELQRARREAEALKERYLDLYDFAPVGYFTFDIRGTILSANLTGANLLGIERGLLINRRFQLSLAPDSCVKFSECVREIVETGEKRTFEVTLLVEGKAPICVQIEGIAVQSIGTQCRAAVMDISERKRVERQLRESTERLNLLVENSPLALVEFDPDCRIVRWTAEAQRLFGWDAGEVTGRRICDFPWIHEEDWPGLRQSLSEMLTGRHPWIVKTTRNYRKDGTGIYCEWYNSALHDASGRTTGILSLVLDVTRQTQVEELLKRQVYLLQRALIPAKPPVIEGYSVASAYIPAFAGTEIGGDFLDVFRTEDGKVGILIGDVSGKGIESAALATVTRSTIGAFAYDLSSPGDALTHTNSMLVARQEEFEQFVTAFLAVLDPATGDINYAGAGHPPAIIIRANGETELLCARNMPLGIIGGLLLDQANSCLLPGDKLFLYTDGVIESRHERTLLGTDGLERILSTHGRANPADLVSKTLDAVKDWSNGNLRDDTAVLVIGRNP